MKARKASTTPIQKQPPKQVSSQHNAHNYLPVSDAIMDWGLYLTGVGQATIAPNAEYPERGHPQLYDYTWNRGRVLPEFQLLLISEGAGCFESEATGPIDVPAHSAIFLFPGVWHRYRPAAATGWTEKWISFSGETPYRFWADKFISEDHAVMQCNNTELLYSLFDKLFRNASKAPASNSISHSSHALALIAETIEGASSEPAPADEADSVTETLAHLARQLIWSHSHRTLSIDQLASMTHVSRRTLERHFRESIGHSLHEEIVQCRLSRAKRLLTKTALPIKAVGFLSGFSSTSRLRADFLSHEGVSPTEYRKIEKSKI
ncbi:MAG: helix-turn-helix domain-containing protein [Phycisphaerales bacterium JB063]